MPPLDTGPVAHTLRLVDPLNERGEPAPGDFPTVGAYLKAVRERRGREVVDLAAVTCIRRAYLAAIEDGRYETLPSRPFAIGYVRAYAQALEVDGEAAAERLKQEMPDPNQPLRAPIGVKHERTERRPLLFAVLGVLALAVVGWNVAQRVATGGAEAEAPPIPVAPDPAAALQGTIALGAPTPPPPEQTTPAPYVTPGLAPEATEAVEASEPTLGPAPVDFEKQGAVYGVADAGPAVLLQARKPASLIVRGAGGEVYFARQLKAGEAYSAPIGRKLSAEVVDPAAFALYINNQFRGALSVEKTALDKLAKDVVSHAPLPPKPARAAAAVQGGTAPADASVGASASQAASAAPASPRVARPAAAAPVTAAPQPAEAPPAPAAEGPPPPEGLF